MTRGGVCCSIIIGILGVLPGIIAAPECRGNLDHHEFNQTTFNNINCDFSYSEDTHLTPRQLITKYGYRGETHRVTTSDGYILEMHRITGPKSNPNPAGKPVVFLMHGLLSSCVDWIITGPKTGLGYVLADQGYDVWMGNARGNKFSRRHKRLSILSKQYWDFSWHEIGIYDLPSMIDYALKTSNSKSLYYAGHSQGTTAFWVMASTKPEYNEKIDGMFALAPVAYMAHMTSPLFRALAHFDSLISGAMEMLGAHEFRPTVDFMKSIKGVMCDPNVWSQPICENIILVIAGLGTDQLNKTQLPVILGHVPAGSSVKQFIHYAQLMKSNTFRQFDYGIAGNMKRYRRIRPPAYDLSKITAPVILHYSVNDYLAHVTDVNRLTTLLPNIYARLKVPHNKFSHLDYLWGVDVKTLIYNKMLRLMLNIKKSKN